MINDKGKLKKMGQASLKIIGMWDFRKCLRGLIANLNRNGFDT